jgi:uncharacterized membrane protein
VPIWSLFFLLLALAPIAAPLLAGSHPLAALLLRDFFSRLCHQNPARSFLVLGSPVAVCARCLGIYVGAALGICLRWGRNTVGANGWLAVALLLNGADVASEAGGWHSNWPMARFALGLLLGCAVGLVLTGALRQGPTSVGPFKRSQNAGL